MVKGFKILLDQPPGPNYFPGMEVSGTLVVEVDEPKNYNAIVIYLVGKGHVQWTEIETVRETEFRGGEHRECVRHETVVYKASETYVQLQSVAWSKSQAPDGMLPPGEHHYQFSFLLPPSIPSSFESDVGWIRYAIEGKIDRKLPKASHKVEARFQVNEIVDINAASLRLPFHLERQKTAGFLCCKSAPIVTTVEVPRTGYCIGEEIPFRVTVENGGSRPVQVAAVLEEKVIYLAQGHDKAIVSSHAIQKSDPVEPQSTTVWVPEVSVLKIPVTTPTSLKTGIIQRTFALQFTTRIPRVLINPTISVPLTVGNVPYTADQATVAPGNNPPPLLGPPVPLLASPHLAISSVTPEAVSKVQPTSYNIIQ